MSPYPDWLKIRILVGKIRIHEKNVLTESTSRRFAYFIFSTLKTVLFGQVPPKPNQKHHLDSSSLLMDGWMLIRVFKVQIRIGEKTRIHSDRSETAINRLTEPY